MLRGKGSTTTTRHCCLRFHRRRSRSCDTLCSSAEYINYLSFSLSLSLPLFLSVSHPSFFLSLAADGNRYRSFLFRPRRFPRRKGDASVYAGEQERDPSALRITFFAQRGASYPSYPTRKSRPRPSDGFNFISIFSLSHASCLSFSLPSFFRLVVYILIESISFFFLFISSFPDAVWNSDEILRHCKFLQFFAVFSCSVRLGNRFVSFFLFSFAQFSAMIPSIFYVL